MKRKDIKFLDLCLIFCAALIVATWIYGAIAFSKYQAEPAEMMAFIGKICSAEGLMTTILALFKIKNNKE